MAMVIADLNDKEKSQVQMLRALMGLHGLTVADVSMRSFIPQENIEAFLSGVTASLSDPSFHEVFRSLGMDVNGSLVTSRVHFWHVKMKRARNKDNLLPLNNMMKHLGEHSAMALTKKNNTTPILMKAGDVRIVIFVHGPRFMNVNVADLGLNPGAFAGNHKLTSVPKYYYDLISLRVLRPNYFDLVLNGTYINEDIDLLRMAALDHDVTLSELINYVIRNDKRLKNENEADSKPETVTDSVISLHSSLSVSDIHPINHTPQAARG